MVGVQSTDERATRLIMLRKIRNFVITIFFTECQRHGDCEKFECNSESNRGD